MVANAADLAQRLRVAEAAARAAGEVHRRYFGTGIAFETKLGDRRDMLTQADIESQAVAKDVIARAFPGETIVGEEDGLSREDLAPLLDGACWTVDPLDGTQSFVQGFPVFGPGIAYVEQRRSLAGAVYLPVFDEMYVAARGLGARLNGTPIHVAAPKSLEDAMVGVHIREASPPNVEQFLATTGRVLTAANGIRLLGSPMICLVYIAAARLDCFATLSPTRLGVWDLAPAEVILEEAGGVIADPNGGPFDMLSPGVSGASSRALLDELFAVVRG
ncbi:MAG TPA: inositol monophosphatase family protein [Dehalococcoidia bacterium]|nr:inositol monophosphatase family protein [Dehalococcoidia bacterium]